MEGTLLEQPTIDTSVKRWYVCKTNGIQNLRSINVALATHSEQSISFWLPGYMYPKKFRNHTVLRKQFLYYDYAFVEMYDPIAFSDFLQERKIHSYLLRAPGTKVPAALTIEEIQRVKQLEIDKQTEIDNAETPLGIRMGSLIEVCNGPWIGCKGTVIEIAPRHVVLEMNVFGRPTRVNVGIEFLSNVLQPYESVDILPGDEK